MKKETMLLKTANTTKLIFLLAFTLGLASCEKVINPDLAPTEPVIVIEGGISDQSENHTVKISKTAAFDQPNSFNGVKDAKVTVLSSTNQLITFTATTDGTYRSPRLRGVAGVTYTLQVVAEGKTYTAVSKMPMPVRPDSINFKRLNFFGNSRVYPSVYYKDPANAQNQYRYIIRVNNKLTAEQVSEDRFNNGNATSDLITFDGDGVLQGDKVDIEMQCIDRNVFKYYYAISQIGGGGGPPVAPSNPDTNLDNGALGIFSAYTKTTHSVTLK